MRTGGDYFDSYRAEWAHFGDAVRSIGPVASTIQDGRRSLDVVLAAAQSINTGQPVRINDAPRNIPPAIREDLVLNSAHA